MKRGSTLLLKTTIIIIGAGVLAVCIFALSPALLSGKAGDYGPILIGMYVSAIPFFIGLYHALKLLGHIDANKAFSDLSVKALRSIKYCAFTLSGLYAVGMPYIVYVASMDDAPGAVGIGLIIVLASFVVAVFAGVLERLLQSAMEIKSENDLTV